MNIQKATPKEIQEALEKAHGLKNALRTVENTLENLRDESATLEIGLHREALIGLRFNPHAEHDDVLEAMLRPYLIKKLEAYAKQLRDEIQALFTEPAEQ